MTNCTLSGNSAELGAGIFVYSELSLRHSTVAANTAELDGGGLLILSPGAATIGHSIVGDNEALFAGSAPDVSGVATATWSLIESTVGAMISGANNIVQQDPRLSPLANHGGPTMTHELLADSPARNAGDAAAAAGFGGVPLYDQRGLGFNRIAGGRIDLGAVESGGQSADFDVSGAVDGLDFLIWQRGKGASGAAATRANGNANGDNVVDGEDLTVWQTQYGTSGAVAADVPATADAVFASGDLAALIAPAEHAIRRPWRPRRR